METITATEAAKRLGVSRQTITNWAKAGRVPDAERKQTELGNYYWSIPVESLDNIDRPKNGRPYKEEITEQPEAV